MQCRETPSPGNQIFPFVRINALHQLNVDGMPQTAATVGQASPGGLINYTINRQIYRVDTNHFYPPPSSRWSIGGLQLKFNLNGMEWNIS